MKSAFLSLTLATSALLAAEPAKPAPAVQSAPSTAKVVDLRVESQTNPTAVNTPLPRFSWRIETEERGWLQKSYHILVASTPELLAQDKGDLWDSGEVKSAASHYISFEGLPMLSNQKAFWKISATGNDDKATSWSDPSSFAVKLSGPAPVPVRLFDPASSGRSGVETNQESLNAIYRNASSDASKLSSVRDLGLALGSIGYHACLLPSLEIWLDQLNLQVNRAGYYPAKLPSDGSYGSTQSDAAINCMLSHWLMTGDISFLQRYWGTLYRYGVARSKADPGWLGRPFGEVSADHLPKGDPTPPEFVHLASSAMSFRLLLEIGTKVSRNPNEITFLENGLKEMKEQFDLNHVNEDGSLCYDSLTAHLLALRAGLLTVGPDSKIGIAGLAKQLDRIDPNLVFSESPFASANTLQTLTWIGQYDRALALAMAQDPKALSPLASTGISEWLISMVAGIKMQGRGFRLIRIAPLVPHSTDLSSIKAHYDSPAGRIVSSWKREGKAINYKVLIPPSTISTVEIHLTAGQALTSGSRPAQAVEGVKGFRIKDSVVQFILFPGSYEFRAGK